MNCIKVKKKLSALLDNEIDQKPKPDIEHHLTECPACEHEYKLLTQIWNSLEAWEKIEPSDNFEARFWQKAREKEPRLTSFQGLIRKVILVPIATISLMIGVMGGIHLGQILFPGKTKPLTEESLLLKRDFLYLDNFEDFPPESLAGVYLSLTSQRDNFNFEE